MAPVSRLLTVSALLITVAAAAAAAQPLKPEWSRPVGDRTRLVGVEEYGRCSVFVDKGAVQVVAPSGAVSWTWPFGTISKYINPRDVAVSHECDAIAFAGDASYKYVWIVDRAGMSASIKLAATPADVEFDRTGRSVAVGTYAGSLLLYSVNGELLWMRPTQAKIVEGLAFADDNQHIRFDGWSGSGVVSVAGHVESSVAGKEQPDDEVSGEHGYRWRIATTADGGRMWLRADDRIDCVDDGGTVFATIVAQPRYGGGVFVSRDFGQVLVVTEKDLHPVSVERYAVPAPCRK